MRSIEDPRSRALETSKLFFLSLVIKLFILKLNLLFTNFTGNRTEKMYPEHHELDETDRTVLQRFEVVRSSHRADGK